MFQERKNHISKSFNQHYATLASMIKLEINSVRTFIGAKDFAVSKSFYKDLGFKEAVITDHLSLFKINNDLSFYLQNYYVKDWLENTMLSILVTDVNQCFDAIQQLELDKKYPGAELKPLNKNSWGTECLVIDPAGVLLRFTQFY